MNIQIPTISFSLFRALVSILHHPRAHLLAPRSDIRYTNELVEQVRDEQNVHKGVATIGYDKSEELVIDLAL